MAANISSVDVAKSAINLKEVTTTFKEARRVMIALERIMARKPEHRSWSWKKFGKQA